MCTVFLIMSISVEPALLSAVGCVGDVGFILILKGQVFSSNLYKHGVNALIEESLVFVNRTEDALCFGRCKRPVVHRFESRR